MVWSPLEPLLDAKWVQFWYTDNANNQGFILYYMVNGIDICQIVEHAFFYLTAVANNNNLDQCSKAEQFDITLLLPANALYSWVLAEQCPISV